MEGGSLRGGGRFVEGRGETHGQLGGYGNGHEYHHNHTSVLATTRALRRPYPQTVKDRYWYNRERDISLLPVLAAAP